jgi:hypothetical protein
VGHRAPPAGLVRGRELLQLPDLHYKVELVDKVLVLSPTGLAVAAAVPVGMVAAVAEAAMTSDPEPDLLLVAAEDLDT